MGDAVGRGEGDMDEEYVGYAVTEGSTVGGGVVGAGLVVDGLIDGCPVGGVYGFIDGRELGQLVG